MRGDGGLVAVGTSSKDLFAAGDNFYATLSCTLTNLENCV